MEDQKTNPKPGSQPDTSPLRIVDEVLHLAYLLAIMLGACRQIAALGWNEERRTWLRFVFPEVHTKIFRQIPNQLESLFAQKAEPKEFQAVVNQLLTAHREAAALCATRMRPN